MLGIVHILQGGNCLTPILSYCGNVDIVVASLLPLVTSFRSADFLHALMCRRVTTTTVLCCSSRRGRADNGVHPCLSARALSAWVEPPCAEKAIKKLYRTFVSDSFRWLRKSQVLRCSFCHIGFTKRDTGAFRATALPS